MSVGDPQSCWSTASPIRASVWGPVVERLAADLHVVSYDVRGAGRSEAPASRAGYALPLLVEDLAAVVDQTSPDAPRAPGRGRLGLHSGVGGGHHERRGAPLRELHLGVGTPTGPCRPVGATPPLSQPGRPPRGAQPGIALVVHRVLPAPTAPRAHDPQPPRRPRLWAVALHRIEHARTDGNWPAPTFGADFSHGVELYRANVYGRMRRPVAGHTEVPVQLIVPVHDRYVTPALLDGLEEWASSMWRRPVDAGHWVIRSNPDGFAAWVREVVSFVEDGVESDGLRRYRVAPTQPAA